MPSIVFASVVLPEPDSPDETQCLTLFQTQIDADQRGHVVSLLLERLGHVVHLEHDPVCFDALDTFLLDARSEIGHLVGVMASRPALAGEVHHGRQLLTADVSGELAAVDEHAGRQRGADLREAAGNGGQQLLVLAHAVAREGIEQAHRVGMAGLVEDLLCRAFLDHLAGVHDADPVAHRTDHTQVVRDQEDRRIGLARSVRTRSSTSASTVASSPVVGSSSTSSRGSQASAMAITTRCCIPPENWCG